ncbi:MAG: hypothetical protein AAGD22_12080 [Verrucomicrobiota bacterium]
MQGNQRRRHRVIWMVVGLVVGVMMVWGLGGRKGIPLLVVVPVELEEADIETEETIEP